MSINNKGFLVLENSNSQDIEQLWGKLEKEKPKLILKKGAAPKTLSLSSNIVEKHSFIDQPSHGATGSLDSSFEHFDQPSNNPFDPSEPYDEEEGDFEYDDPFDDDDIEESRGDEEVQFINFKSGRQPSREFSLSRYDVDVRPFKVYKNKLPSSEECLEEDRASTLSVDDDDEEFEHDDVIEHSDVIRNEDCSREVTNEDRQILSNSVSNKIYYIAQRQRQPSNQSEETNSVHLPCDCEDCINQTDVIDCQCEHCLQQREVTQDVTLPHDARDVTCDCDECINRWNKPDYTCQYENCEYKLSHGKEKGKIHGQEGNSNTANSEHCMCIKCTDKVENNHIGYKHDCDCERCVNVRVTGQSKVKGHRSPPQGSSQEYPAFDLEHLSQSQQGLNSDHSFDSGTEKSVKSVISEKSSKSSHSVGSFTSSRSGASGNSKNNDLNSLTKKLGQVQLIDQEKGCAGAYINLASRGEEFRQCTNENCTKCDTVNCPQIRKLGHENKGRFTYGNNLTDNQRHQYISEKERTESFLSAGVAAGTERLPRKHTSVTEPVEPDISPLLEQQLQKTEKELKDKTAAYDAETKDLRRETDKQQKLIQHSLSLTADAKIEATMQHEITRLTSENLDLREQIDQQADQIRKLKKMLKVYAKRMKEGEAAEIQAELDKEETKSVENVAQIKHRERNYMGMLEYKKEDEGPVIKCLILDLKPKVAAGLLPGLPAYLLFMCVRHTDYVNDDEKVRTFLTSTINGIKKVVKKHHDDLDRVTMWLANTCRFLHTLKQYSGEKQFQQENSARQNEHCLRNFDLAEYRQVFSDLAVWIYQTLIKLMEATIQPSIVAAVLDHEAIAGLTGSKPSGLRGRSSSRADDTPEHSLDSLMKTMNQFVRVLTQHAVDPELIKQIFRQVYYFLGASALNNLLLRKEMCNWSKGMQIRYNLSHMEQWLRDNKLQESGAGSSLEPIVQASQLLQARKTDADVDSVCEMCSKLTVPQIVKILNLYTPVDEFEERVPISFIRKIQQKLKERVDNQDNSLLMDLKFSYSVTFPFNPSKIAMETIEVPEQLHIGKLVTRL